MSCLTKMLMLPITWRSMESPTRITRSNRDRMSRTSVLVNQFMSQFRAVKGALSPTRPPPDIASNICCRVCYGAWDWIWRSRDEMLHEERCLYFAKVSTAFRTWEDGSRSCGCGIDRDCAIVKSVLYYVHSHILLHASSNLSVKFEVGKNRFPNQKDNHSTY